MDSLWSRCIYPASFPRCKNASHLREKSTTNWSSTFSIYKKNPKNIYLEDYVTQRYTRANLPWHSSNTVNITKQQDFRLCSPIPPSRPLVLSCWLLVIMLSVLSFSAFFFHSFIYLFFGLLHFLLQRFLPLIQSLLLLDFVCKGPPPPLLTNKLLSIFPAVTTDSSFCMGWIP